MAADSAKVRALVIPAALVVHTAIVDRSKPH
jgi:hypothetical protein